MEKILYIPAKAINNYNALMRPDKESVDYKKQDIPRYELIEKWTVDFGNGYEVDIKVCSSDYGDPLWCEGVLFFHGSEVSCTDVSDELTGEYSFEIQGEKFAVHVKTVAH